MYLRLLRTRYETCEIDVLGAKAEMGRKIETGHVHGTDRVRFSGLLVSVGIEPVYEQAKNEMHRAVGLYREEGAVVGPWELAYAGRVHYICASVGSRHRSLPRSLQYFLDLGTHEKLGEPTLQGTIRVRTERFEYDASFTPLLLRFQMLLQDQRFTARRLVGFGVGAEVWIRVVRLFPIRGIYREAIAADSVFYNVWFELQLGEDRPDVKRDFFKYLALLFGKGRCRLGECQRAEYHDFESSEQKLGLGECDRGQCVQHCDREQSGQEKRRHVRRLAKNMSYSTPPINNPDGGM